MFWFCKRKVLDIHFFTTREEIFNHAKPKKASEFIPEWFKGLPKPSFSENLNDDLFLKKTIKTCPAFLTLYSSGFMFPLWSDLNIEIYDNSYRYQFADKTSSIDFHNPKQFYGYELADTHTQMKLINPWFIQTNEDVKLLFTAPIWNGVGNGDVVIAPGAFTPDAGLVRANINIFVKKNERRVIHQLFFNQPLVHVVPLTDRPIKLHHHLVSEAELATLLAKSPYNLMDFKKHQRARKFCKHEGYKNG